MASSSSCFALALMMMFMIVGSSNADLTPDFYDESCPQLPFVVGSVVHSAIEREARMGASLLRLFFHDCFVQGCDGSILLDGRNNEKFATPSFQSARGFEVVDQIKDAVEEACPGVVSCADILAITARDSVHFLGGPYWDVKLGRRDARTANQGLANSSIPPATSSLSRLISSFKAQGLSTKDLVALYGAHTIGQARCTNFRTHIYNENNIDASFAQSLRSNCPSNNGTGDNNLGPLDVNSPTSFDNAYFKGLMDKKATLHSDQELYNGGGSTDSLVRAYSNDERSFGSDFVESMIKMGDIKPLTGNNGEIRKNCRVIN